MTRRFRFAVVAIVAGWLLAGLAGFDAPRSRAFSALQATPAGVVCADPEELALLESINALRASAGAPQLVLSLDLSEAAEYHAAGMAATDTFGYTVMPDQITFDQNIENFGYPSTYVGMTIAAGLESDDAATVFGQWQAAPSQLANLLNPRFQAIGIGHATNDAASLVNYWVATFGDDPNVAELEWCRESLITPAVVVPTATAVATETVLPTETPTATETATASATPTQTATEVPTAPPTAEPSATPTTKPTDTPAPTQTATPAPTETSTAKPTDTATSEPTKTATPEPTATAKPKPTKTSTIEPTATAKPKPTKTPTVEPTAKPSNTPTPKPTKTATPKPTNTAAPTKTVTPKPTSTPAPTKTATPKPTSTPAPTKTATPKPEPTKTPTPKPAPTKTATSKPAPTKAATPKPAPTKTATPKPTVAADAPDCEPSRSNGRAGQEVVITCSGFAKGESVDLFWDVPRAADRLETFEVDGKGAGEVTFLVPEIPGGQFTLIVRGQDSKLTSSIAFVVRPGLFITPRSGDPGDVINADLTGFQPGESVSLIWYDTETTTVVLRRVNVGEDGSLSTTFRAADSDPGKHTIEAVAITGGTASTSFELNEP